MGRSRRKWLGQRAPLSDADFRGLGQASKKVQARPVGVRERKSESGCGCLGKDSLPRSHGRGRELRQTSATVRLVRRNGPPVCHLMLIWKRHNNQQAAFDQCFEKEIHWESQSIERCHSDSNRTEQFVATTWTDFYHPRLWSQFFISIIVGSFLEKYERRSLFRRTKLVKRLGEQENPPVKRNILEAARCDDSEISGILPFRTCTSRRRHGRRSPGVTRCQRQEEGR